MEKSFLCAWTDQDKKAMNFYNPEERVEKLNFFTEDNGYTQEDIHAIKNLGLGQVYECTYGNHRIKRIQ